VISEAAVASRPRVPAAINAVIVGAIGLAALAALVWPALPFNDDRLRAAAEAGLGIVTADLAGPGSAAQLGAPAPEFRWVEPGGASRSLRDLRGRPVVINFWATYCVPCKRELPALDAAAAAEPDVAFLAIDMNEDAPVARRYLDGLGIQRLMPLLDDRSRISRRYAVAVLPMTYFIDAGGFVRRIERGPLDLATIRDGVTGAR
jgi:thiol-disulfide isomerase/thioredoxin